MNRPELLDQPIPTYMTEDSEYPDQIRQKFKDGRTIIYDRRQEFPNQIIERNIEIIRRMKAKAGYVNQPMRRRRKA